MIYMLGEYQPCCSQHNIAVINNAAPQSVPIIRPFSMTRQCSIGQQPTGAIFYIVSKNSYLSFHCRQDSTIVTPYESWQYYDPSMVSKPQNQNYAGNKSKKVAWFVSNCGARNGRLQYAQELSKYIRHHPAITL